MAPRRASAAGVTQAEVVLLPQLKSCLANLPPSLVSILVNANTIAQNVVVELDWRLPSSGAAAASSASADARNSNVSQRRSTFVGWTGMQSQTRIAPVVSKSGISRAGNRQEQDIATVELDAAFGRMLGIADGQKVGVNLHIDPPQAHTVNIEPLTPTDWDIIELHARFLEMNFLSQVRALPNPAFPGSQPQDHPLTLHLTPTSTASIVVTSLSPAPPSTQAFVKISPDAEVIVAPKSRHRPSVSKSSHHGSRSVASESRKSVGGKSSASTVRRRSARDDPNTRHPVFLRAVDRKVAADWFDGDVDGSADTGLRIWVDRDVVLSRNLKGVTWVAVSVVRPAALEPQLDPQTQTPEAEKPASKVVARLCTWDDGPDSRHAAMSTMLCAALHAEGIVGGIVRVEAAPSQVARTKSAMKEASKDVVVRTLRIQPFSSNSSTLQPLLKFGGDSNAAKEAGIAKIKSLFGETTENGTGLLEGPLTDGMILPAEVSNNQFAWPGGVLRFDPLPAPGAESSKRSVHWLIGSERKLAMEILPEIPKPRELSSDGPGHELPAAPPTMVGIDAFVEEMQSQLHHSSSILLTGGLGSGKTSLAQLIAHRLRSEHLYHTIYFPCASLVTDETRISAIKETLQRIFGAGAWGARLGGRALVVLDDIDKLCPVETELQVGGDNGRSRQVSELLCSIAKQSCGRDTGVVLLATAQAKESVNNVVIGGHVVRDIVTLKAPNKEGRRKVLELLVHQKEVGSQYEDGDVQSVDGNPWMDNASDGEPARDNGRGFIIDPAIDLLDVAGQTDGYMPGDLALLVARAHSEALIRSVSAAPLDDTSSSLTLTQNDFTAALKGFTPASLRNVTLQSSTTTFSSIGGLHETRQTLLETLQYPTTYAPIFAHCPLRLRSGLLLYGYPGCGKTMLASAVAGECGLNFISVKGPEILNKYIGASEKSVRDLFERAEAARPCVLFFDEFDSIAPKRGHDSTGVTDRVVNQLLTQMDGAEGLSGVYVLAATSRPDLIDPALLRPGRLDKSLICDMPSLADRLDILRAVSRKLKLGADVTERDSDAAAHAEHKSLEEVARRTQGYSGADLQAVMYNAHLEAIHDVLGPADLAQELGKSKSGGGASDGAADKHARAQAREFTYFRLGDEEQKQGGEEGDGGAAGGESNKQLAERAAVAAKLAALETARRRRKQMRHEMYAQQQQQQAGSTAATSTSNGYTTAGTAAAAAADESDPDDINAEHDNAGTKQQKQPRSKEPIIHWQHISASLESTRPSISRQEQRRLAAIYKEFLVGRNGEMPDGQAGTEIGGRTSLM